MMRHVRAALFGANVALSTLVNLKILAVPLALPDSVSQCQHIKVNGLLCESPALRGRRYCHFHQEMRDRQRRRLRARKADAKFPVLEDANAVQCALMQTIDDISNNRIDTKKASLLLYALQTASLNLKRTNFEPHKLQRAALTDLLAMDAESGA